MPAADPSNILGIGAKSVYIGSQSESARAPDDEIEARAKARKSRYKLLRKSQGIMYAHGKEPADQYRVVYCGRCMKNRDEVVGVRRRAVGGGARYTGLSACGSVWHCPVCASKISEKRREELGRALSAWVILGNVAQLMTLTFPHEANQDLAPMQEKFAKAMQAFKSSRAYKAVFDAAGRAGSIRSLEATWGENGWHPHTHDLVFLRRALTVGEIDTLKTAWVKALNKKHLCPNSKMRDAWEHGLDVQDGQYAAEYIAKFGHDSAWGMSSEMTKPHAKLGRLEDVAGEEHFTPFQLLAWAEAGDEKAAALFREFGEVFHGKRMLAWSPSLRALLNLGEEIADADLAADDDPMPEEIAVGVLTVDQFHVLVNHNAQGEFLEYVNTCCTDPATGQADIDGYIDSLAARPASHAGTVRKRRFFGRGFDDLYSPTRH